MSPTVCLALIPHDDVVDFGDDHAVALPSPITCCGACEVCTAESLDALAPADLAAFLDWSDERAREALAHRDATEGAFDLFVDTLSGDLSLDCALPCELAFVPAVSL